MSREEQEILMRNFDHEGQAKPSQPSSALPPSLSSIPSTPIRPLPILKRPFIVGLGSLGIPPPQQILLGDKGKTFGDLIVCKLTLGIVKHLVKLFEGKLFCLFNKEEDENKGNDVETSKKAQCSGHLENHVDTGQEDSQKACEK